ncbi:MAG: response regulator [Variovorax sp.]|nr:MAG: response regulator [Variovorax sp.]
MGSIIDSTADEAQEQQTPLRILVVEDDPDALATTVDMLQALGHWTAGVKSAEVARDRFIEGAFDVLLTDVGLPALSGIDLVEILQPSHKLRVIFATGQMRPEAPMPGTVWLQKPFGLDELSAALRGAGARTPTP